MTPEEFKQIYTMRVLTKKPFFVYRIDGTLSVNLIVQYDPESDHVHYFSLKETDTTDLNYVKDGKGFKGKIFSFNTVYSDLLSLDLENYARITYEYDPKNYGFRWHNEKSYVNEHMKYAKIL